MLRDVAILNIWTMDTALTGVIFAMAGKLFFIHRDEIMEKYISKLPVFVLSLIVYGALVAVSIIFYPGQTMDFHKTQYYNPVICLVMIFTGITCCIYIAKRLKSNKFTQLISVMGQNTLVVYLLNGIIVVG